MRVWDGLVKMLGLCLLAGVLLAGMLFPLVGTLGVVSNRASDTVDSISAELVAKDPPLLTTVTDKDGVPIAHVFDQYRVLTAPDKIADTMKAAIVAIEDQRFYDHKGVDWRGTLRALITNQLEGETAQGASTLTQQYVKNYLMYVVAESKIEQEKAREQSYARKMREARIALQMERELTKDDILTRYLNIVPFGNNTYGIAAAAQVYFNTTPDKLTIAQAALLAGLVNQPSALNPGRNAQPALERRNRVIKLMAEQRRITPEAAEAAINEPLGTVAKIGTPPNGCINTGDFGYFCDYVLKYLDRIGYNRKTIGRGGYTIKTTLDRDALLKAKAAADAEVSPKSQHVAHTMAVVAPGKDRHRVIALTANRQYGLNAEARETAYGLPYEMQNMGAGSIYKVFTATAALEKGLGINTVIPTPYVHVSNVFKGGGKSCPSTGEDDTRWYCARNSSEKYPPQMTLHDALAQSPNTGFVILEERTGVGAAVDMAVRLGLRSMASTPAGEDTRKPKRPLAQYYSDANIGAFTLGPVPTSTVELANVGATLASEGTWCPPSPIEQVVDRNGKLVALKEQPCEQVVAPGLANTMMHGLGKDHTSGTASGAARLFGWTRPMAGKTGTTQDHKSAGFVGFTPQLSGAVFTFDDTRSPKPLCDPPGNGQPRRCGEGNIFGGKAPAQTWFRAMNGWDGAPGIMTNMPVAPLPAPDPRYLNGGDEAKAPSVVGMGVNEARARLEQAGYKVRVQEKESDKPKGTVVSQTPRGTALRGETITLIVSNGIPPAPTPPSDEPTGGPVPPTQDQDPGNGNGGWPGDGGGGPPDGPPGHGIEPPGYGTGPGGN